MTLPLPIVRQLEDYIALLECELELVRELLACSTRQRHAAADRELTLLGAATHERGRAMERLAACESAADSCRALLRAGIVVARSLPRFADALRLQSEVTTLLAALAESDARTRSTLEQLNEDSRTEVQAIETGGATLAAYRRVIAPAPASAALVNQRG